MRRTHLTLTLALVVAAPTAFAGWAVDGAWEPDTRRDAQDGYNHLNPDTAVSGKRVYFNAIQGTGFVPIVLNGGNSVNPNSGIAKTSFRSETYIARALLGVWKDCNKDGFVGWGDQGLFEYRFELLAVPNANGVIAGVSVCPVTAIPPATQREWANIPHNDGAWVHEFIPIGWDTASLTDPGGDYNPWHYVDNDARVWGDEGVPRATQPGNEGGSCYITSHPRGSFDSVGTMIGLADCFAGGAVDRIVRENTTGTPAGTAYDAVKGIQNPWGHEEDASMVNGFDCANPIYAYGTNETDEERDPVVGDVYLTVPSGTPTVDPSSGSIGGTVNETETQFGDCERGDKDSASVKNLPYSTETDISNDGAVKNITDYVMRYKEEIRNPSKNPASSPTATGRGTPPLSPFPDAGTRLGVEGTWGGSSNLVGGCCPWPSHVTFYAYVSPAAVSKFGLTLNPTSKTGMYGTEVCTSGIGTGQPVQGGWDCDPAKWWPAGEGDVTAQAVIGGESKFVAVRVGQAFQLRDIDCYDASATGARDQGFSYGAVASIVEELDDDIGPLTQGLRPNGFIANGENVCF